MKFMESMTRIFFTTKDMEETVMDIREYVNLCFPLKSLRGGQVVEEYEAPSLIRVLNPRGQTLVTEIIQYTQPE